jgi:hypothetical protein
VGAVELDHDGAAHKSFKVGRTLQSAFQTCGADLKVVGFGNGILLVQNGIHSAGDGLAVGDIHAALFFDVEPQESLGALADILHIPEGAAVGLYHRLSEGFYLFSDLQNNRLFPKKERG